MPKFVSVFIHILIYIFNIAILMSEIKNISTNILVYKLCAVCEKSENLLNRKKQKLIIFLIWGNRLDLFMHFFCRCWVSMRKQVRFMAFLSSFLLLSLASNYALHQHTHTKKYTGFFFQDLVIKQIKTLTSHRFPYFPPLVVWIY